MSEAFDWSWIPPHIPPIDLDTYVVMPEEIARRVVIHDGRLVHCESASPNHIAVSRAIEQAFRNAVRKRGTVTEARGGPSRLPPTRCWSLKSSRGWRETTAGSSPSRCCNSPAAVSMSPKNSVCVRTTA